MVETLHYGLKGRRVVGWSRALVGLRKEMALEDEPDPENEDLIGFDRKRELPEAYESVRVEVYGWDEKGHRYGFGSSLTNKGTTHDDVSMSPIDGFRQFHCLGKSLL
jgi:hypothetical protein